MTINRLTNGILLILSLLLVLGLAGSFPFFKSAGAEGEQSAIGRYQIAAWGSYSGERVHHSGYYVLDTVTGRIVDQGHSVHGIGGAGPPK